MCTNMVWATYDGTASVILEQPRAQGELKYNTGPPPIQLLGTLSVYHLSCTGIQLPIDSDDEPLLDPTDGHPQEGPYPGASVSPRPRCDCKAVYQRGMR